jgi:hypothetical protein
MIIGSWRNLLEPIREVAAPWKDLSELWAMEDNPCPRPSPCPCPFWARAGTWAWAREPGRRKGLSFLEGQHERACMVSHGRHSTLMLACAQHLPSQDDVADIGAQRSNATPNRGLISLTLRVIGAVMSACQISRCIPRNNEGTNLILVWHSGRLPARETQWPLSQRRGCEPINR